MKSRHSDFGLKEYVDNVTISAEDSDLDFRMEQLRLFNSTPVYCEPYWSYKIGVRMFTETSASVSSLVLIGGLGVAIFCLLVSIYIESIVKCMGNF